MSRVTIRQYPFDPLFYRFPAVASRAVFTTRLMASRVDRDFLKPYSLSHRDRSTACTILLWMIRSRIFPAVSIMQRGRYDEGSSGGFFPLARSTSLCHFHFSGKMPSFKHALYVSRNISGAILITILSATLGIPSKPGALVLPTHMLVATHLL